MNNKELYEIKANILKSLAHPVRLWVVDELSAGEKCVCEFVNATNLDFSTISKHLLVLKNAGIIRDRKDGKKVFYALNHPDLLECKNCLINFINERNKIQTKVIEKQ